MVTTVQKSDDYYEDWDDDCGVRKKIRDERTEDSLYF